MGRIKCVHTVRSIETRARFVACEDSNTNDADDTEDWLNRQQQRRPPIIGNSRAHGNVNAHGPRISSSMHRRKHTLKSLLISLLRNEANLVIIKFDLLRSFAPHSCCWYGKSNSRHCLSSKHIHTKAHGARKSEQCNQKAKIDSNVSHFYKMFYSISLLSVPFRRSIKNCMQKLRFSGPDHSVGV